MNSCESASTFADQEGNEPLDGARCADAALEDDATVYLLIALLLRAVCGSTYKPVNHSAFFWGGEE